MLRKLTRSAVEDGLKVMSAVRTRGPGGGGLGSASWVWGRRRKAPRGVRPLTEAEKQVIPAGEPPLATHARQVFSIRYV